MIAIVERGISNLKVFFSDTTQTQIKNSYTESIGYRILKEVRELQEDSRSQGLGLNDVYSFINPRREFRHAYLASTAVFLWGIVESIILVIAAIFAAPFDREKKMKQLAKKSVIECASNGAFAAIGFVGQFSPKIGVKAVRELSRLVTEGSR
jgi:hypothetical protein